MPGVQPRSRIPLAKKHSPKMIIPEADKAPHIRRLVSQQVCTANNSANNPTNDLFPAATTDPHRNSKIQPNLYILPFRHLLQLRATSISRRIQKVGRNQAGACPLVPSTNGAFLHGLGQGAKKRQPMHSAAVVLSRRVFLTKNGTDIFLCFKAGRHQLMATAKASHTKIRPNTQHYPAIRTAGMRLLHNKNII